MNNHQLKYISIADGMSVPTPNNETDLSKLPKALSRAIQEKWMGRNLQGPDDHCSGNRPAGASLSHRRVEHPQLPHGGRQEASKSSSRCRPPLMANRRRMAQETSCTPAGDARLAPGPRCAARSVAP